MSQEGDAAFVSLLSQFADGARWKVLTDDGRQDLAHELASEMCLMSEVQREALLLCMFALLAERIKVGDLFAFILGRRMSEPEEVENLTLWVRQESEDRHR
jgi:hypothetical protein